MATTKATRDHLHETCEQNATTAISKQRHKGSIILDKKNPSDRTKAETAAPKKLKRVYDWSKTDSVSWFKTESGIRKYQAETDQEEG